MKVWMLTHSGEGMPTNTILFREEHPPSTERVGEFFYKSLLGDYPLERGDKEYYKTKSVEMAKSISEKSYWTDSSQYEGANLSLVEVE